MFDIIDGEIDVSPAILNIPEFKVLWKRDKDRYKKLAFAELSYIYYMVDFKSPYRTYSKDERHERIVNDFISKRFDEWSPDKEVKLAILKYEELHTTPSLRYLEAVEGQLDKITNFLNGTTIDEDVIRTVVDSVDKANKIILGLPKLKEAVQKEIAEKSKIRGGGELSMFED
jgi:hypothetical protein